MARPDRVGGSVKARWSVPFVLWAAAWTVLVLALGAWEWGGGASPASWIAWLKARLTGVPLKLLGYGTIWSVGMLALWLLHSRLDNHMRRHLEAEEALRRGEKRLRRAEEVAHFGNWEFDLVRSRVNASYGARLVYGLPEGDLGIADVQEIPLSKYRSVLDDALRGLIEEDKPYDVEFEISRPSDKKLVHIHSIAEYDAARRVVFGVIQDITARKLAEDALRASEEKYRHIVENQSDLISRFLPDGTLTFVNEAVCRLLGANADEIVGKSLFDLVDADTREGIVAMLREVSPQFPMSTSEQGMSFPDGREVWIQWNKMGFFDDKGNLVECQGVGRDITERKRAEKERLEMERRLQQTQKLESLGVLAGGIAHDFNNLLMAIMGQADLALDELSPLSPARESIRQIVKASRRASDLCRQMLAYSGRGQFVLERVDLKELVEEMVHLLKASMNKKAILNLNLERGLPPILADASQIRQIFMNLVINASEAIGERSGVITISTGAMECDAEYLSGTYIENDLPAGLYVYLEVSDTGCGMDESTRKRVFEPFFTTKFTGRGLGMAAVLGIVRSHKGAFKLYSEPGKGTTFKALFPALLDEQEEGKESASRGSCQWEGSGLVLLVDDEDTIRSLVRQMLERLGFSVLTAADGKEALEIFREHGNRIHMVLLDMTMPHMDGVETFRELRRMDAGVRIILSSGYTEQDIISRFAGKGPSGFIQKPYTLAGLRAILRLCDETEA